MNEIVKIDPKEYGLEETKAKQIEEAFRPMLEKMTELEAEYNEVAKLEISEETCKKAKELRLKYVKVRTGTANIHKDLKAFYLAGGRFVDGWKNAQLFASQGIEDKLKLIEDYYENLEKERIVKLQEQRASVLTKYEVDPIPANLGSMSEMVWANFLVGTKTNYEAQKEAERKAEEQRIKMEKSFRLHNERKGMLLPYWDFVPEIIGVNNQKRNEFDFSELTEYEWKEIFDFCVAEKQKYKAEQDRIKYENDRLKKEAEETEQKRLAEEKVRKEKEAKERAEYESKIRAAEEERLKAEKELRLIKEAEEKAAREKMLADKKAAKAPDKDKILVAIKSCSLEIPKCKTQEAEVIAEEINQKFAAFKKWATSRVESI